MLQLIRLSYNAIGFSLNLKTAKLGEDAAFRYMTKPCVFFFVNTDVGAHRNLFTCHTPTSQVEVGRGGGGEA